MEDSRKKSHMSSNYLTCFVLVVTSESRTLESEIKTCKMQLSEMNDSC